MAGSLPPTACAMRPPGTWAAAQAYSEVAGPVRAREGLGWAAWSPDHLCSGWLRVGLRRAQRDAVAASTILMLRGRTVVSDKSPQKSNVKKLGKSLKEKRAAKKAKRAVKPSLIPPTGH